MIDYYMRPDGAAVHKSVSAVAQVGGNIRLSCIHGGYIAGDRVNLGGFTDPNYNGTFTIQNVPDGTHFDVTAPYTATGVGKAIKACGPSSDVNNCMSRAGITGGTAYFSGSTRIIVCQPAGTTYTPGADITVTADNFTFIGEQLVTPGAPIPFLQSAGRALSTGNKNNITMKGFRTQGITVTASSITNIAIDNVLMEQCLDIALYNNGVCSITNFGIVGGVTLGKQPIYSSGAGALVTARNGIIAGNRVAPATASGGSFDIDYCILSGNGYTRADYTGAGYGAHNIIEQSPGWITWPIGVGYLMFNQDDQDVAYAADYETALAPYNKHHSFFINESDDQRISHTVPNEVSAAQITTLQGLVTAGLDLLNHSKLHNPYNAGTLITVTKPGLATTPTINNNKVAQTITLDADGSTYDLVFDYSTGQTLNDFKTAATAKGWTVAIAANVATFTPCTMLVDTSGAQSVASPYALVADTTSTGYYASILDNQTWLNNNFGTRPKIFAYPYGYTNATVQAWLKDTAGYIGVRGYSVTNYIDYLNSVSIFNSNCANALMFQAPDTSEASVRERTRQVAIHAMCQGAAIAVLAHHNESTGFTPDQIGWIADEASKVGLPIVTMTEYYTAILPGGSDAHTSADGYTYTKTYSWAPNFKLRGNSPCINAGDPTLDYVALGITTDIEGKPLKGIPDIGVYEYQPSGWLGIMF